MMPRVASMEPVVGPLVVQQHLLAPMLMESKYLLVPMTSKNVNVVRIAVVLDKSAQRL